MRPNIMTLKVGMHIGIRIISRTEPTTENQDSSIFLQGASNMTMIEL